MRGDLQIKRISPPAETPGTFELLFQTYEGETFTGSTPAPELKKFLREKLCLRPDEVESALHEIQDRGGSTLKQRDIEAIDLVGSGLKFLQDEG